MTDIKGQKQQEERRWQFIKVIFIHWIKYLNLMNVGDPGI